MKKRIITLGVVALSLAAIAIVGIVLFASLREPVVGEFALEDYQWEIESFPSDENVGEVDTAETAIEKSKELWTQKFATGNGKSYDCINGRKVEVFYDPEAECWYVRETLPRNTLGGVPHAIIRKNGDVIAVWHDD